MRNEKEMEPLISLDHVTYRYPFTGRDAVTDISIDVKPGEAVLVTGVSGCGKTTLISPVFSSRTTSTSFSSFFFAI